MMTELHLAQLTFWLGFTAGVIGLGVGFYCRVKMRKAYNWAAYCSAKAEKAGQRVDPWALMHQVMSASGQWLPGEPTLHKGVILYSALNLEELGETLEALLIALRPHVQMDLAYGPTEIHLRQIYWELEDVIQHMGQSSRSIRKSLEQTPEFRRPLTEAEAIPLFDGTVDLSVTNCGFALSCGLPGAAGYAEGTNSNLSKRNPTTGVIDKDAGGKWIKGPNYRAPDLAAVLRLHNPTWALEMRQRSMPRQAAR